MRGETYTDLLIIGSGVAGSEAAFAAKKENPELSVWMVSPEKDGEYGAGALPDYLSGAISREDVSIRKPEDYERAGIRRITGETVTGLDPESRTAILDSGACLTFGTCILATGSVPVQLRRMEGTGLPGNFILKTREDVEAILAYGPKRVVVVGSGAIGLEGAQALRARGAEVTMVELLPWISKKSFDEKTADKLKQELEAQGIRVYLGENVKRVLGSEKVEGVETDRRTFSCDLVLWAIGVRPVTGLAEAAGLKIGESRGIWVDDTMQTSAAGIYACGDCTESWDRIRKGPVLNLLWKAAAEQGSIAGFNAATKGSKKEFPGSVAVFLTYVGEKPIVSFGKTEGDLQGHAYEVLEQEEDERYVRILLEENRIVGVQMVGTMEESGLLLAKLLKEEPIDWDLPAESAGQMAQAQAFLTEWLLQIKK